MGGLFVIVKDISPYSIFYQNIYFKKVAIPRSLCFSAILVGTVMADLLVNATTVKLSQERCPCSQDFCFKPIMRDFEFEYI